MFLTLSDTLMTCLIAGAATAGVVFRPWRLPEAVFAVAGAVALVLAGYLGAGEAVAAVGRGTEVYLFLIGMMLLAEVARANGVFDWFAAYAVRHARGSPTRLFGLVYAIGVVVTVFLSNDATAVVLTPAVYAAARAANAEPRPYLYVCAFVANAASFVLPISNPANLVVYGDRMPGLIEWLRLFTLPSLAAIVATYVVLRFVSRKSLRGSLVPAAEAAPLSIGGRRAAVGLVVALASLVVASALRGPLGLVTFIAAIATAAFVLAVERQSPMPILRHVTWSVVPFVAGLFVLVEGVERSGALQPVVAALQALAAHSPAVASWAGGLGIGVAVNLVNNLPAGLLAGSLAVSSGLSTEVTAALLIGVDLGPNLSTTGSLATLLWLIAIRRDGESMGALSFLKLGLLVMPPALILALATLVATFR